MVVGVAASSALVAASVSAQILRTWPDASPPCNGTLQACIDAALPEDTVEIATSAPIDEDILSQGSLDLRAAPGFHPVFADGAEIVARAVAAGGSQTIRIEGLTLTRGHIQVLHNNNPNPLTVQIVGNTILAPDSAVPMSLFAFDAGQLDFLVSGNRVSTDLFQNHGIAVNLQETLAFGTVADNVVPMPTNNDAIGIEVVIEDGGLFVDVARNRVEGLAYLEGIALRRYGTGGIAARVFGNLARGATAGGAGIVFEGNSLDPGSMDVQIINNTVDGNWNGIESWGLDIVVANNLVTDNLETGLAGSSDPSVTTRNNLFHGNQTDVEGPAIGAGTLFANPLYAGAGSFRLAAGSPAIDAGDSSAVPPEVTTDLAGSSRIQGAAVDIGAYETPEPAPGWAALAVAALWVGRRLRHPTA